MSDWTCPAVRELACRTDFRGEAAWVAKTLVPSISIAHAQRTLDALFELGLLQRLDDGTVRQAEAAIVTPSHL